MQEERKKIIGMVKEGKLSTEEALILLDALENKSEKVPETNQAHQEKYQEKQQYSNEQTEDNYSSQFNDAKDKIMDFVNTAFKKIKDIDLNFNQSVDIPHVYQQANVTLTNIDIDVANGHVEIKAWDQPEVRVECQARVYRKDKRDEARAFFIDNSSFYLENGLLRFSTQSKWMKVDTIVYIPKNDYEKVSIRTFNGSVTGEGLSGVDLKAKTANGKIVLKNMKSDKLDAETVNGKIFVTDSIAGRFSAETMHGSIDVEGEYESIDLQTLNGNLSSVLNNEMTETLHLKAVSGNINVYLPSDVGIEGDCKSNLGNVKITLENIDVIEEKKEMVQKQVRFKRSSLTEKPIHIFAETRTGNIIVQNNEKVDSRSTEPVHSEGQNEPVHSEEKNDNEGEIKE
ncbi:DUF4097 family beta strand repeat-containing protein [Heyndrickxia sporothermodurans]|uniref:DUF4097 family beta strand repeat protein n=1 Tax=Heyndrickxia sporothermodurans TaxID=46224 RepID=A0AB37HFH6_9BACI|nr:DUF4097 family beta strand repeat-containing protein [Heyndrickxia sporothermodurans]MBL5767068.1 DUF4097 family beta strand repeat protein [Heyndrickxia sporothermodurans]MBL5770567.1 DUF4097 family beta strand repeat protein [Heyndrickxia sporothermodurans]MBL5774537.1 DUF4097 family beta strand repeat protein [Heyndrickxia sporothermodurans]MBL5777487.1 DUF4097 family beta strand repeat protein [Heyndrickxia sporothermodurans]MBL5781114.1 DUF4097 family beta strand repeat protein [Heyndr